MLIFEKQAPENTLKTIEVAFEKAHELDTLLVVASTSGNTAIKVLEYLESKNEITRLVIVSHAWGTRSFGKNAMADEIRERLSNAGVPVVAAAHVLSGVERGLSTRMQGVYPAEIMAHTLRMLSAGVKVTVEISVMALDAGNIPYGNPVVAVGGSGGGADTAVLITPSYSHDVLSTRVHEIYCKPF